MEKRNTLKKLQGATIKDVNLAQIYMEKQCALSH